MVRHAMPTQPKRETHTSFQITARLPKADYEALKAADRPVAGQVVEAVRAYLAAREVAEEGRAPQ